jgi:CheY-like chemotaxis protein
MTKRILVVEDQEDLRGVLRTLLTGSGYAMLEAVDGETGVARAKSDRPDLILMDIPMPENAAPARCLSMCVGKVFGVLHELNYVDCRRLSQCRAFRGVRDNDRRSPARDDGCGDSRNGGDDNGLTHWLLLSNCDFENTRRGSASKSIADPRGGDAIGRFYRAVFTAR